MASGLRNTAGSAWYYVLYVFLLYYVLDNEPRNIQIVRYNERLIELGKKICIWPSAIKEKDINARTPERPPQGNREPQ